MSEPLSASTSATWNGSAPGRELPCAALDHQREVLLQGRVLLDAADPAEPGYSTLASNLAQLARTYADGSRAVGPGERTGDGCVVDSDPLPAVTSALEGAAEALDDAGHPDEASELRSLLDPVLPRPNPRATCRRPVV